MELQSSEVNEIAAALLAVQHEIKPAVKGSENPYYHSKYADLKSVWDSCDKELRKNGIAVFQGGTVIDGKGCMVTTLLHTSGQWIRGAFEFTPAKDDPQAYGSNITYLRRYSLAAAVGIVMADDDGEAAMQRGLTEDKANLKLVLENLLKSPALSAEFVDQTKAHMSQKQVKSWYQEKIREINDIIAKQERAISF